MRGRGRGSWPTGAEAAETGKQRQLRDEGTGATESQAREQLSVGDESRGR